MNTTSSMTMAEALSLSLRAWPTEDPNSESLPRLIPRINEQRSAFRNVTELGLEEEIRVLEASEVQAEDREVEATGAAAEDSKSKKEEIVAAREDLLKQVA